MPELFEEDSSRVWLKLITEVNHLGIDSSHVQYSKKYYHWLMLCVMAHAVSSAHLVHGIDATLCQIVESDYFWFHSLSRLRINGFVIMKS